MRRTPLLELDPAELRDRAGRPLELAGPLYLKLESLQRSGSFKLRGALNAALTLPARPPALVTASGGNHGAALACAGRQLGLPVRVYLPRSTPAAKLARLDRLGAEVELVGEVWDEADAAAQTAAAGSGAAYVHPFADPAVIAGNGTVAAEVLSDLPELASLVVAVGGGGLIAGCALAAAERGLALVGVEPEGAATLGASRAAGELVTLPAIETRASSLAPRRSAPLNFSIIEERVGTLLTVSDAELEESATWLREELGLAVELSSAASLAALRSGRWQPPPGPCCLIVCGAA